ncbi:MAG: PatB family C-S lyase [Brevinematales bacterium]|jgi:cystathionine beta-lyase
MELKKKYDFDAIIERANTDSIKWDGAGDIFGRKDILPMWVADMDFASPPGVIEAIKKRASHGLFGYTGPSGRYHESFIRWMETRHKWEIMENWLLHSPGVVSSIINSILAFTEPGDPVLIQPPVYHPFYSCIKDNHRRLVINPLKYEDSRYSIDFDDLDLKLSGGVKMMVLCSPHNPVGRVWKKEELLKIGELCLTHGTLLVSDEIHCDIVFSGHDHIPMGSLSREIAMNTVTCISATKTFNLAGLAESLVIAPDEIRKIRLEKTLRKNGAGILNIFGMTASQEAFGGGGEEWVEELIEYLQGNLKYLTEVLDSLEPRIKLIEPEGTYLAWLDCRSLPVAPADLNKFFIHEAGVGLNDGAMFGTSGSGFQRLNFACPRSILEKGMEKIEKAVKRL